MEEKDWRDLEDKLIHVRVVDIYPSLNGLRINLQIVETGHYFTFDYDLRKEET